MAKIIVLGAMKGGVGKSVSTYNLAYSLNKLGKKVLVVDFDSSANITRCVVEDIKTIEISIGDLMMNQMDEEEQPNPAEYIINRNGVDFIPSSKVLSAVDAKLRLEMGAEKIQACILEPFREEYDYILIDTCPSLNTLTINALSAADEVIMSKSKTLEERHFYITLCIKESYSSRELERQINSGYYERYMLSKERLLPEPINGLKENPFLDSYVIEFLDLPKNFKESDLQKGLIQNMKDFILEVGKDFTFIDEEYKVQVGSEDFRIDLLFFHRGLQCLVAFELKIGKFKPEYISKMDFYLEALDRQKKKQNENPSVGMILCASKDDEVVEYAMSRTLSPMMVAEYKLQLPDKTVLQKKLQIGRAHV